MDKKEEIKELGIDYLRKINNCDTVGEANKVLDEYHEKRKRIELRSKQWQYYEEIVRRKP